MTKQCPVCDYVVRDPNDWRQHLKRKHDWDPTDKPSWVGDFLLAVGLGFLLFLSWGMTGNFGFTSAPASGSALTAWWLLGVVALPAGLVVLAVQPLRRIGYRRWIASRRGDKTERRQRRMTTAERGRLRLINAATTGAMTVAFVGIAIAYSLRQQNSWWPVLVVTCLLIIGVAGFARARVHKRLAM